MGGAGGAGKAAFDVVVVGARCAGSPLAAHLARAGLSVAVLDRARFPSDVISTHTFQRGAIQSLDRLGVLDRVRATGAPRVEHTIAKLDDGVDLSTPIEDDPAGLEAIMCVRRTALDPILVDAAVEAGAEVRTGTIVRDLVREDGRVAGVVAEEEDGRRVEVRAPLVVGADGVASTIARLVGARRYNLVANGRFYQYAYYAGVRVPRPTPIVFNRKRDELAFACPTNEDLVIVTVGPRFFDLPAWRADPGRGFDREVAKMEEIGDLVSTGRRVTEPRGVVKCTAYFRESAGPGWVLVGDAGHFKDPTPGQGIADALRQAERVATDVVAGLGGRGLDARLRQYWRWRDRVGYERHWWASDIALPGPVSPVTLELLRRLSATPEGRRAFWEPFLQGKPPREVLRRSEAVAATVDLLRTGGRPRAEVVLDGARLAVEEAHRWWSTVVPQFERKGAGARPIRTLEERVALPRRRRAATRSPG